MIKQNFLYFDKTSIAPKFFYSSNNDRSLIGPKWIDKRFEGWGKLRDSLILL